MLSNETIIKATNRDLGSVGYDIPDLGITRHYSAHETKEITFEELKKLSYSSGGKYIIEHCLILDNDEAVKTLLGEVEPEYYYTEDDVKELLLHGSLEQLEDCLDFAGDSVINLVKDLAVKLEINDIAKRKAIQAKTGLNVDSAILHVHEAQEDAPAEDTSTKTRRAAPVSAKTEEKPARRTEAKTTAAASKYQVKN